MKRKFINFSDNELDVLKHALEAVGDKNLIKQLNKEKHEREYNRKMHEEWMKSQPKIYCC